MIRCVVRALPLNRNAWFNRTSEDIAGAIEWFTFCHARDEALEILCADTSNHSVDASWAEPDESRRNFEQSKFEDMLSFLLTLK